MTRNFKKILVANRGEIAIRVFRAASELGIQTVGIFSKEDKYALFRAKADESYQLSDSRGPVDAYLDIGTIIKIAKSKNVDAIHPGYGFLSENPEFAEACRLNGITFIGPDKQVMEDMGDKISSKLIATQCDVPIIPGTDKAVRSVGEASGIAEKIGYPILLKASNGGGGRGMRVVNGPDDLPKEFAEACSEAKKAFGDDKIFIEKYLRNPKHIEVQVLGDNYGNIVHLYDRDCSVQRRHQKVIEFAPAFTIPEKTRGLILDASLRMARKVGYKSAGTMEFLVDENANPYFIEMNTRIQVEHTVTEMITGIDIVQAQILIAQGYSLDSPEINIPSQESVVTNGYSIQTRITSENPANNFLPDTGKLNVYRSASGMGIRLDGGTAFTGAEISPYYDSMLVKLISFDRSFVGATQKALRALKEMRIRGVKTNIPFLVNVLNHPAFRLGNCSTTFIESAPELFHLQVSQDRATKIIEFIGNQVVNNCVVEKPYFDNPAPPKIQTYPEALGSREEFQKFGAAGFAQKILNEKKLYVTDTTMRDAHQSLLATRMRTKDLVKAAAATNEIFKAAFSVEAWGGATFDTAYRFLKESPWKRLESLREKMPNTLIQMLLRASSAVGYTNYPDNMVREFIHASAETGVDVFRIFDSLNWLENMKMPIEQALKTDKIVEGAVCYTGDILNPEETKYTVDYYIQKALDLEKMGCHIIALKDMAGLLKPYAAKKLVTELKRELHIPLHLHTHDSTGNGVSAVLMAAEAGVDIVDLAVESMSSLTSQPSMNSVVAALYNTPRDTGISKDGINELSRYYGEVRKAYTLFESGMNCPNTEIYEYEIPGGQYSNLLAQAKEMGSGESFEEIKRLYKQANHLLGNIIKVTPSSKVVGDLAIFMLKNGLDGDNILEKGKALAYPDSVVDYFKGMIGQPDGGFPPELQRIVLKGQEPVTQRPGLLLEDVDFESIKNHLVTEFGINAGRKSRLSYALYPKVYDEYCRHFETYHDVTMLESHIYFYGLRKGEETTVSISEGKDLVIKFADMTEPDQKGYRSLTFEVNGSMREVKVLDKNLEVKSDNRLKADKNNPTHLGATLPGTVVRLYAKPGDLVKINDPILVIEAMKMETTLVSTVNGTVDEIYVAEGDKVDQNELMASFVIES